MGIDLFFFFLFFFLLTRSARVKNSADNILKYFSYFSYISFLKYQNLFSGKNKKNISLISCFPILEVKCLSEAIVMNMFYIIN